MKKYPKKDEFFQVGDADKKADTMVDLANDLETIKKTAKRNGIPEVTARRLKKRMETKFMPTAHKIREVTVKELLRHIDDRALSALEYMSDEKFSNASLKDLAITMGILLEKRQLLRGEPTQILSVEERGNLNDLLPMVVAEAQRRNITIDQHPMDALSADGAEARALGGRVIPDMKSDTRAMLGNKNDPNSHNIKVGQIKERDN